MNPYKGYSRTNVYSDKAVLPPGGYVVGILGAEEKEESWGRVLEIRYDVCEGEHKNYYTEQYKNNQAEDKKYKGVYRLGIPKDDGSERDEWSVRKFNTAMLAIEDSNAGYQWDWDEKKLVGKVVGAVFQSREYDYNGYKGFTSSLHSFRAADKIRSGDFKIPEPKMLDQGGGADFPEVRLDDGELPF